MPPKKQASPKAKAAKKKSVAEAKRAPAPPPPPSTFREDVARVEEASLLDARKTGLQALALTILEAHADEKAYRLLEGQSAPMIRSAKNDAWYQLAAIVDGADPDATMTQLTEQEDIRELVDGDGRVTVRRGIGKHETMHATALAAWIRRDKKPVQVDLEKNPIKPLGLRVDPWKKTGVTLETDHYIAKFSDDALKKIRQEPEPKQLAVLRRKMKLRPEIEEDPADHVFTLDRFDMLRYIRAREA